MKVQDDMNRSTLGNHPCLVLTHHPEGDALNCMVQRQDSYVVHNLSAHISLVRV